MSLGRQEKAVGEEGEGGGGVGNYGFVCACVCVRGSVRESECHQG